MCVNNYVKNLKMLQYIVTQVNHLKKDELNIKTEVNYIEYMRLLYIKIKLFLEKMYNIKKHLNLR